MANETFYGDGLNEKKRKIVHGRGPSNINLGIFVCSCDIRRAFFSFPSKSYAQMEPNSITSEDLHLQGKSRGLGAFPVQCLLTKKTFKQVFFLQATFFTHINIPKLIHYSCSCYPTRAGLFVSWLALTQD